MRTTLVVTFMPFYEIANENADKSYGVIFCSVIWWLNTQFAKANFLSNGK